MAQKSGDNVAAKWPALVPHVTLAGNGGGPKAAARASLSRAG
jgi:hypothetical protein